MRLTAPLLLCLTLTAAFAQTRPDFSGTWTRIPAAAGQPTETLTLAQTPNTLTADVAGRRWVHKLDGSESKHVATDGTVQISTSRWEGDTLVTTYPIQSGPQGPYVLRVALSLDGKILAVRATSTSQATGAVFLEETKRYSK
jgi:hypothetical protein